MLNTVMVLILVAFTVVGFVISCLVREIAQIKWMFLYYYERPRGLVLPPDVELKTPHSLAEATSKFDGLFADEYSKRN